MEEKEFNITPYFFSHKGDNVEEYKKLLIKSLEDYVEWRKEYHNEDFKLLKGYDENSEGYKEGLKRLETCYDEMLNRLHKSIPFHSPRYLGHMMSENFMPSVLANFATLLYNLNNVCYEGSPVTVEMEYEIAKDFAKMIGYDTDLSWGHLTGGGTVANIEALWVVRNMKYFPLIAQNLAKTFRKDFDVVQPNGQVKKLTKLSQYELLTLTPDAIKTLLKDFFELDWGRNINQDIYINSHNISHVGMHNYYNGKIFVPASKHYSWDKAAEILGFGRKNIVLVEVDENFRMNTDDLKEKLIKSVKHNEPIVAVVGVMGTTEASSVDSIDKIQEIKTYLEKEYNVSFFLHIDAAYGGYAKSLFLDKNNSIKSYEKVREFVGCDWPSKDIYNAYCSMHYADSVTVDPHKLGYLPFGSGAVIYKNKITKPATISHAPYISSSTNPENEDLFFGEYILEGSKSGAAAAACWLANKVIPLNDFGYGKLLKNEIIDSRMI
ncbi:MAG: pyridoxal-dependent decarboxylase, partial [bacterium]|nr:pyridoxal-dependent decarboxylase [bacterium]